MDIGPGGVRISPPTPKPAIVGMNFTLNCSVDITPFPLPESVSFPTFEWLFGPGRASISPDVLFSNYSHNGIYSSSLHFSPLHASHEGKYTCQLTGNNRLTTVTSLTLEGKT